MNQLIAQKEAILSEYYQQGKSINDIAQDFSLEPEALKRLLSIWIEPDSTNYCRVCKTVELIRMTHDELKQIHRFCQDLLDTLRSINKNHPEILHPEILHPEILVGILAHFNCHGILPRYREPGYQNFNDQFDPDFDVEDYLELISYLIDRCDEIYTDIDLRPIEELKETYRIYSQAMKRQS